MPGAGPWVGPAAEEEGDHEDKELLGTPRVVAVVDDDAVTARQLFLGGFLGLPLLWLLSYLHLRPKLLAQSASREAAAWAHRSLAAVWISGAIVVFWVVYFQLRWRSWGGWVVDYMAYITSKDMTYW
uniref:Uncharacterized protein n=1 Tax=Rhizochromulina marina TaxID=1034831 RepID=A0A7S2SRD7_9STRA|mmetsp:Transcript_5214/g.15324  ORF Transcript_5214/g.15324 Transcript_5214/m.15324 type:complete len:127 (+) Transcript_5214:14-394(+)